MYLKQLLCFIFGVCSITFGMCEEDNEEPIVELKQGKIKGHFEKSYFNKTYTAFEGIPYAKPPIGDLRFRDPQPAGEWEGILPGDKQYTCAHLFPLPFLWGPMGKEDCLYLYVYVPGKDISKDESLPVVVHIHGGAFMIGSPAMMAAPDYMMDQNVIYVTINYRLGILGFLSTEDDVVPGNMGLKDQAMALKWIKENIADFGGNPNSVTITGLSAGGASVHYHYLSPMSRGLFARGFSQSGTALNPWALTEKPLEKAKFVAKNVSCDIESTEKMVTCLKSKTVKELIEGISGLFVLLSIIPIAPFGPVVEKGENSFLPENPYKIMKDGNVYDVPWINSNVKDEGIFPVGFYFEEQKLQEINENWNDWMMYSLDLHDVLEDPEKNSTMEKIRKFYFQEEPLTEDNYEPLVKVHSDRIFFLDSELATKTQALATTSPVYYYFYGFLPESHFHFGNMKPGISHGLDGKFMFKWLLNPDKLEPKEEKMMTVLTEFLAEYATNGIPKIGGTTWNRVDSAKEELDYMEINSHDQMEMKSIKEFSPSGFWNSLPIKENAKIN